MEKYTVTEIAKMLNVNEETVRRWIRSGYLKATATSRKKGYIIDKKDLYEFVKNKPKYSTKLLVFTILRVGSPFFKTVGTICSSRLTSERINKRITELLKEEGP